MGNFWPKSLDIMIIFSSDISIIIQNYSFECVINLCGAHVKYTWEIYKSISLKDYYKMRKTLVIFHYLF